jgi:hypothetical protein
MRAYFGRGGCFAAARRERPQRQGRRRTHMQIEERIVGDVTILDLKGKMTLG